MNIRKLMLSGFLAASMAAAAKTPALIDLSGDWKVSFGGKEYPVCLPGTLDAAGLGEEVDTLALSTDEKFRRLTRRHSYIGPATYSKEVYIPKSMAGIPLRIELERVLWKSDLKIDGVSVGNPEISLVAPHEHDIPEGLTEGKHLVELTVDNSKQRDISFDNLAHAYTNDTQVMWNGVLGRMNLTAVPDTEIRQVNVYPNATLDSIEVVLDLISRTEGGHKKFKLSIDGDDVTSAKFQIAKGESRLALKIPFSGRWDEFNGSVNLLTVKSQDDEKTVKFGMRTIDADGGIRINGNPTIMRGTLECCFFPLTGTPPTDREGWMKTFTVAKIWGLNHLRFHSWCPPEAAFDVADDLGMYLQVELPVWSLKIGDSDEVKNFLKDEYDRLIKAYGNHPSLCMISVGNELQYDFEWLNDMVRYMKECDPRHLYTATSFTFEKGHGGHPEPEDQYFVSQWTDDGWVRGQGVFEENPPAFDKNYITAMGCVGVPLITHEIGQYAVYPSMREIEKYTGTLNPLNFKQIRDDLASKGMLGDAGNMTMASGNLAAILYKEEIERALKTPGISGYQLLGLTDFPGQGTALVGLLDAFWDPKGFVYADWFRQFSSPVVPLLDFGSPILKSGETFSAVASISNSYRPLDSDSISWRVLDVTDYKVISEGKIGAPQLGYGLTEIGEISFNIPDFDTPHALYISVGYGEACSNSWRLWAYPEEYPQHRTSVVATRDPEEAVKALGEGRRVLLAPAKDDIDGVKSRFLPVFWSPVHFKDQAGTMGIMCDPGHPALTGFPNDGHTDWQWWSLVRNAKICDIDSLYDSGCGVKPIVKAIDNFVTNRRLAYVFEAKVGNGSLLFSGFDILNPELDAPEIKAMRESLLRYAESEDFRPEGVLSEEGMQTLFVKHGID